MSDIVLNGKRRAMGKLMLALLAGSVAVGSGSYAFARTHAGMDPAKAQEYIGKRVERALKGTDATDEQKKKVTAIMQANFADLKPLRAKGAESFKAMKEAMQAPTLDKAKIEQIRADQMKVADESSKRMTKALTDAGDVLNQSQRQAFFKNWSSHRHANGHAHKHG